MRRSRSHTVPLRLSSYRVPDPTRDTSAAAVPVPSPHRVQRTLQVPRRPNPETFQIPGGSFLVSVAQASSTSLTLLLPVPPSINHQYATVGHRRLLSSVGRKYKAQVSQYVLVALAQLPKRETLLRTLRENQLALSIHFHFSAPLRRDVDGGLKITQDALCEALGINDNRVQEIHLYKAWADAPPHIQVSLSPSKIRQGSQSRRMPTKSTLRPSPSG